MVRIEGPDGKSFCIDTTEVSQGHYRAFLDVKKDDPGPQPEMCKANKTLEPPEPPSPELNEAGGCWPKGWSQTYTTSPEKPMTCVDWCDARAYCEWAGKRLCGKIGGGSLTEQELKNAKESEWSYACSQGNKSDYPYGDKYQAKVCNISNKKPANNTFSFENVGTSGCHGDGKPYDQLLDMIGNTYEWQDGAFQAPDSEGSDWIVWYYPLRGGSSYIADKTPEEVTCSWSAAMFNLDNVADIGFRCCAD